VGWKKNGGVTKGRRFGTLTEPTQKKNAGLLKQAVFQKKKGARWPRKKGKVDGGGCPKSAC